MPDMNELIEEAYEALCNAEANEYPQWDKDIDEIVVDMMDYHSEFEDLNQGDVRLAVIGALAKYDKRNA